jgi:hypothetical protein
MSARESAELREFRRQVARWLEENKPARPKFELARRQARRVESLLMSSQYSRTTLPSGKTMS